MVCGPTTCLSTPVMGGHVLIGGGTIKNPHPPTYHISKTTRKTVFHAIFPLRNGNTLRVERLLRLLNVREEKSGKPFRLTLPLLASVHPRTCVCVWGCGSVWSHCGLLPCVSLTALLSSNPGWAEAAWGQLLSLRGSEVSAQRVMPELQLNRE